MRGYYETLKDELILICTIGDFGVYKFSGKPSYWTIPVSGLWKLFPTEKEAREYAETH